MGCTNENQIKHIIDNHSEVFFGMQNVVGIGHGNKYTNGCDTGEACVHVYVQSKLPQDQICPENLIPEYYHGEKTDVIEVGVIESHGFTAKVRPMLFGYSIGPSNINLAGTASCLVYDFNNYYILSNNHVMAGENANPIGTPILQPGRADGGLYPRDVVATLSRFVPILYKTATATPTNYADCAISKVVNVNNIVSRNIAVIGGVKGLAYPEVNLPVRKSGRTTGYTTGKILASNVTVDVAYSGGRVARFAEQVMTTAISAPGDSGSLVVDNASRAVGLLFAGSPQVSLLNYMGYVLGSLGIQLALN